MLRSSSDVSMSRSSSDVSDVSMSRSSSAMSTTSTEVNLMQHEKDLLTSPEWKQGEYYDYCVQECISFMNRYNLPGNDKKRNMYATISSRLTDMMMIPINQYLPEDAVKESHKWQAIYGCCLWGYNDAMDTKDGKFDTELAEAICNAIMGGDIADHVPDDGNSDVSQNLKGESSNLVWNLVPAVKEAFKFVRDINGENTLKSFCDHIKLYEKKTLFRPDSEVYMEIEEYEEMRHTTGGMRTMLELYYDLLCHYSSEFTNGNYVSCDFTSGNYVSRNRYLWYATVHFSLVNDLIDICSDLEEQSCNAILSYPYLDKYDAALEIMKRVDMYRNEITEWKEERDRNIILHMLDAFFIWNMNATRYDSSLMKILLNDDSSEDKRYKFSEILSMMK